MDFIRSNFPVFYRSLPSKRVVFEAVVIRDYRVLVALLVSFAVSIVLVVFDLRYWWTYEKKRCRITLLPAASELRDSGCGAGPPLPPAPDAPSHRDAVPQKERVEELFVAGGVPSSSTSTSTRCRRRRPHHPFTPSNFCPDKTWEVQQHGDEL